MKNKVKDWGPGGNIESTQIGLKSAKKMMKRMDGDLVLQEENGFFGVELRFLL